jgi:BMFP domain-containing protein YqiC
LRDAMQGLQRDAEQLLHRTRRRASAIMKRDRKAAQNTLLGQAQVLRRNLEKQAQQATRDIERRADRFRTAIEKEVNRRLGAFLARLDLPSRTEVAQLNRRITQIEQRVRKTSALRPTKKKPPIASRPPSVVAFAAQTLAKPPTPPADSAVSRCNCQATA